jgi:mono/diheme cytochrome c family protein
MNKKMGSTQGRVLVLSLLLIVSCKHDNSLDQDALDQEAYDNADAIRGGQLYDKFWTTDGYTGPSDPSVSQENIDNFPDFYRCKQCHGWDLRANVEWYIDRGPKVTRPDVSGQDLFHMREETDLRDMFEEVAHEGAAAVDPARTADGTNSSLGGNNMPDFSKILTEAQIWDLVKFMKEGAFDTRQLYDLNTAGTYPTGTKTMTNLGRDGDASAGDSFYATKCVSCHGTDGTTIDLHGESVGSFIRSSPHEAQHKVKNGHPGTIMGGLPNATQSDIKNLFKAMTDESKYPALTPKTSEEWYADANAINGGQLYDKFWTTDGYKGPADPTVNQDDINNFPDFYRCKQCHGWDVRANTEWYIDRAPTVTRPDVAAQELFHIRNEADIQLMYDNVAHAGGASVDVARTADGTNPLLGGNDMPDYTKILSEAQIWDIVKFLKEGAFDTRQLYDLATAGTYPTGTKSMTNLGLNGVAASGDAFYAANCVSCHGADGRTIDLHGESVGSFIRSSPHEAQHKIKNGHPGTVMGGLPNATQTDIKNLYKAMLDLVKYPD